MFKILTVINQTGTNNERLVQGLSPYMDRFDYHVLDVHSECPTSSQLARFEKYGKDADIIDFYDTSAATLLLNRYPWLKYKKKILTHYSPYSQNNSECHKFDKVIATNKTMHKQIPGSFYIPQTVDTNFWTFNPKWNVNKNVIIVTDEIKQEKGILEVAVACRNLGLNLFLVGLIADKSYFSQVMQTGCITFREKISYDELQQIYSQSTLYVCNSKENCETGPISMLEAILCGVPVLTRLVGHVPELYKKDNIRILNGSTEDIVTITRTLKEMLSNEENLKIMREKAWQVASKFADERRAYSYQRLYRSLLNGTPVSVIVTIYEYPQTIQKCLDAIADQDYPNLELVVCDDNPTGDNKTLIEEFARSVSFPVIYRNTSRKENDYGLARARNVGIIEASGDILVFCDQRISLYPNAISEFVKNLAPKKWLYGTKGLIKGFVENFSCVYRDDLIRAGMFCERMESYGGMTQEVFGRTKSQGFKHELIVTAKATFIIESFSLSRRRADIISMRNRLFRMNL